MALYVCMGVKGRAKESNEVVTCDTLERNAFQNSSLISHNH